MMIIFVAVVIIIFIIMMQSKIIFMDSMLLFLSNYLGGLRPPTTAVSIVAGENPLVAFLSVHNCSYIYLYLYAHIYSCIPTTAMLVS